MKGFGIIKKEKTVFVMVDLQEKFVPVMAGVEKAIKNAEILVEASKILGIPLIVTEQYPKGLGKTTNKISLPENHTKIEKIHFSCFGSEEFSEKIKELKKEQIVLFGVETHICILKTALDGLKNNLEVHVIANAVSSRTEESKNLALERMRQSGVFIDSTEMVLYQLMEKAGTDEFKEISKLIR